MANRAGQRRRDGTAEGAGASRLPQAPEQRPLCGELRSELASPTAEPWTVWPWGLHPLRLAGTPTQTYLTSAGGPVPLPSIQERCASVRSRVGAHVSPSQICYCSQSLSDSERPLKFSLIPLFFLEEEQAQDSVCRASGPFSSISPCGPPSTPSLHWSLCLGAVARLQDFISKWWGRGCDHTGEGLREATPER